MGRYRSRSRSYSLSPPPRSKHYDDPRDRYRSSGRGGYRDRRSPAPSGLLIRNISLDARPEDLRVPFERFGPVKDVYLPKNYYTGSISPRRSHPDRRREENGSHEGNGRGDYREANGRSSYERSPPRSRSYSPR